MHAIDCDMGDDCTCPAGEHELEVYCDGSGTHHADSPACIGVVVVSATGVILAESSERICAGTNNVAELWAIRRALYLIRHVGSAGRHTPAIIYSDSAYALGITDGSYQARKNEGLCQSLAAKYALHTATQLQHVKGHAGNPGNELADWLAGRARCKALGTLGAHKLRPVQDGRLEMLTHKRRRALANEAARKAAGGGAP